MPKIPRWLVLAAFGALILALLRPALTALSVGAGFGARVACGLTFHTGLSLERARHDYIAHILGPASALLQLHVSPVDRSVEAGGAGLHSVRAVHRDGAGCVLGDAGHDSFAPPSPMDPLPASLTWPRGDAPLESQPRPELVAALDAAFAEPENTPGRMRQTLAVLIAHRGQLLAERYAPGIDASTPLLSWSAAKSVMTSLIGAAVLEGRLDLAAPAPIPEWQQPGDPRGAITIDHLMRMSSGLAFDEHYGAINDVSRMLFTEPDAGAFAAAFPLEHTPDTAWSYSSGTSNILGRILRDEFDGDLAAMIRWSREAFFEPAGMRSAVFEADASGSFTGSSFLYATARDWARFGQLYLDDGITPDGRRLLPEGFAAYSAKATPKAPFGRYGAGWWTNHGDRNDPAQRMWPQLPRDAYAARGMSGQYVVVVPSAELVVVRMGLAQAEGDALHGIEPLVRTAIDALPSP